MAAEIGALDRACQALGARLNTGAENFRWYYGEKTCDHRIEDPAGGAGAFHVGLEAQEDGSLTAHYDTYGAEGEWINRKLGNGLQGLREQYTAEVAREELEGQGFVVDSLARDETTGELVLEAEML